MEIRERVLRYVQVTAEELDKAKQEDKTFPTSDLLIYKDFIGHQDILPVDITYNAFPDLFTIWFTTPHIPMSVDNPLPFEKMSYRNTLMVYNAKSGFFWREPNLILVGFLPGTNLIALIQ